MKAIPIFDATAPVVCTIGDHEVGDRIELVERLRTGLDEVTRTEHGLLLRFPNDADLAADVARFAVDEKRCCQFWGFTVASSATEVTLRWDGPPDATGLVDRLHAYFLGDEPLTAITGLL